MPGDETRSDRPTPVVEFGEIDSTNREALRRAGTGDTGPLWLSARNQTAGRGRSGRTWQSADGNLAATLLFEPGCQPAALHHLSFVAGIAAYDTMARLLPAGAGRSSLRLKWPNDLLSGNAKLAGILIESTTVSGRLLAAVGLGLNIIAAPALEGRATTSLSALGATAAPREVLAQLDSELLSWLKAWRRGDGFDEVRAAWLARTGPIGEPVAIDTGAEVITGSFAGIDETGALLLASVPPNPIEVRRFAYGDVSLLPSSTTEGSS